MVVVVVVVWQGAHWPKMAWNHMKAWYTQIHRSFILLTVREAESTWKNPRYFPSILMAPPRKHTTFSTRRKFEIKITKI